MLGKLEMSRSKIIASLVDTPFGAQRVFGGSSPQTRKVL